MKNIIDEKPNYELTGRLLASVKFVDDKDIIGKEILDLGCGFGTFVLNFISRGAKKVTGIEITEGDLATAKKYITDPKTHFLVGSAIKIPFSENSFDTVVSWEVIEHIPKNTEERMFADVFRVLRSGGNFYISTPYRSFLACISDPAWWLIGHRHYSKQFLVNLAKNHGFIVKRCEVRGKMFVLLNILNLYFSKWILRRKKLFEGYFEKMDTQEYFQKGYMNVFMEMKKK